MYLVIGGSGFFGSYIIKSTLNKTNEIVLATSRNIESKENSERLNWIQFDISDDNSIDKLLKQISDKKDLKIIILAAYHNPDLVEANPQVAWDINVTYLSKLINRLKFAKKIFYSSTDSVYGNSINGYRFKEEDKLNPVNIYGKNKCAAEAIIIWSGFNVVRFPFLIAPSLVKDKKHFYDKITEELKKGNKIQMLSDSYRSSLNFATASNLLIKLIETDKEIPQILNICGDNSYSKYDIGLLLAQKLGVSEKLVESISIKEYKSIFKTPRAISTLMDNSKLKQILNIDKVDLVL